jgi:ribosomal protein L14E/L6E/L27E
MTACGTKTPSEIAKIVIKAQQTFDFEPAKKYLTEKRLASVEEFIKDYNEAEGVLKELKEEALSKTKETTYEVISEEISEDGNSATVTVQESYEGDTYEGKMDFVKVNGEWKLSEWK